MHSYIQSGVNRLRQIIHKAVLDSLNTVSVGGDDSTLGDESRPNALLAW